MTRLILAVSGLSLLASNPALADDDFAQYSATGSVGPLGLALNGSYNASEKTTVTVSIGGAPEGEAFVTPTVDGVKYTLEAGTSWTGVFVQHRPFEGAQWFRVITGIGFGRTTQTLTDNKGNTYSANYTENPVGYVGVGAGLRPVKGFQIGFDLGLLHTGGPSIEKVAGNGRDASRALSEDPFVGAATLPNVQLTMGWAF